mgnify:FL=1
MVCSVKVGSDGQSGQSIYQTQEIKRGFLNESIFSETMTVLDLWEHESGTTIWLNPEPNSPFSCRHVHMSFEKETEGKMNSEYDRICEEISNLNDIHLYVSGKSFVLKCSLSSFHTTMYDGKASNSISKHITKKVIATASWNICFTKQSEYHSATVSDREECQETLKLGLSVLHCWIRSMEYLFQFGVRNAILPFTGSLTSEPFKAKKKQLKQWKKDI